MGAPAAPPPPGRSSEGAGSRGPGAAPRLGRLYHPRPRRLRVSAARARSVICSRPAGTLPTFPPRRGRLGDRPLLPYRPPPPGARAPRAPGWGRGGPAHAPLPRFPCPQPGRTLPGCPLPGISPLLADGSTFPKKDHIRKGCFFLLLLLVLFCFVFEGRGCPICPFLKRRAYPPDLSKILL